MANQRPQKHLIVLSASYPFGNGEIFLENELPFLVERFGHIFLLPTFSYGSPRNLPDGVTLLPPEPSSQWRALDFVRGFLSSGGMFFPEWKRTPGYPFSPYQLYLTSRTLGIARRVEQRILKTIDEYNLQDGIIYSYWMQQACIGGIMAAQKQNWTTAARVHGGDLYTERYAGNFLPWHEWKVRNADYIFPVSQNGRDYLAQRYPDCAGKIRLMKLGVSGPARIPPGPSRKTKTDAGPESLHLASCSSVIPLKRVDHILETVHKLKELLPALEIRWTHIGNGPEFSTLQNRARSISREGLRIDLKGHLPNKEVRQFYQTGRIDLFVNYSTSEGLPVSIMEAFSCGIPAAAPDVGGIPEIVDQSNGLLFDPDTPPEVLAMQIRDLYRSGALSDMRTSARKKWEQEFRLESNYQKFADFLYHEV